MFELKVLCIGNETIDTDQQVSALAKKSNTTNHGLISKSNYTADLPGFYHTSVADLNESEIIELSRQFDKVIMVDQSKDSYPHWKSFISTFKLMIYLEESGASLCFRDNVNNKNIMYWYDLLRSNPSICFYPFMVLKDNHAQTSLCCKNDDPIKPLDQIIDWQTDPDYQKIRNAMLAGEKLQQCTNCYDREAEGQESTRQFETLESVTRFDLESDSDLGKFRKPVYYEIRPSNKCNIMCRMCDNAHSHLIDKEWKQIGIPLIEWKFKPTPFDVIDFDSVKRIYVAGGEPTVMTEFYDFLEKCISVGVTDFELNVGTNGRKLSNKLMGLLDHFPDVCFSVSFDGVGKVNDYIRWGSDFETIKNNTHLLLKSGHKVGLQAVFSMYNTTRMHEVYEFFSSEFPRCTTLSQVANFSEDVGGAHEIMLPYNYPDPAPVLDSLYRCQKTSVYFGNGRSSKTMIDIMIDHYENASGFDLNRLKNFFEFNDRLDRARNSRLEDYIPELAEIRRKYL